MKKIGIAVIGLCFSSALLWAMPSQITFQGTLKQQGVPVNTTKNMQFSFVDASGANIPGTMPISVANVKVTNGLFAVQLPLDLSIPWEQYTPFIQVSIEGQILSPNQPINANIYAVSAIPQGMIAIFSTTCPTGWSEFTGLRGKFPAGADPSNLLQFSVGFSSGSLTHNHTGFTGPPTANGVTDAGVNALTPTQTHTHTILPDSSLPPYLTIVFCQKQ